MKDFSYHGHKTLKFWMVKGTVLESSSQSQTYVSGGGGRVTGNGTYTQDAIRSHIVKTQEIWIRDENGQEVCQKIGEADVSVRGGHDIAIIYCRPENKEAGYPCVVINYTMGEYWVIKNAEKLQQLLNIYGSKLRGLFTFAFPPALYFGGTALIESSAGLRRSLPPEFVANLGMNLIYIGGAFWVYRLARSIVVHAGFRKKLNAYLNEMGKKL